MTKTAAWRHQVSSRSASRSKTRRIFRWLIRGLRRTQVLWMILLAFLFLSGCARW